MRSARHGCQTCLKIGMLWQGIGVVGHHHEQYRRHVVVVGVVAVVGVVVGRHEQ